MPHPTMQNNFMWPESLGGVAKPQSTKLRGHGGSKLHDPSQVQTGVNCLDFLQGSESCGPMRASKHVLALKNSANGSLAETLSKENHAYACGPTHHSCLSKHRCGRTAGYWVTQRMHSFTFSLVCLLCFHLLLIQWIVGHLGLLLRTGVWVPLGSNPRYRVVAACIRQSRNNASLEGTHCPLKVAKKQSRGGFGVLFGSVNELGCNREEPGNLLPGSRTCQHHRVNLLPHSVHSITRLLYQVGQFFLRLELVQPLARSHAHRDRDMQMHRYTCYSYCSPNNFAPRLLQRPWASETLSDHASLKLCKPASSGSCVSMSLDPARKHGSCKASYVASCESARAGLRFGFCLRFHFLSRLDLLLGILC